MNRILWLRAESRPNERRTPLIPIHAPILVKNGFQVFVESSKTYSFADSAYLDEGCALVANGSWRFARLDAVILGLKERPNAFFPLRHQHMYFAHVFERQMGSRELLERFKRGGGFLYDLEQVKHNFGGHCELVESETVRGQERGVVRKQCTDFGRFRRIRAMQRSALRVVCGRAKRAADAA